jgi:lysozyme
MTRQISANGKALIKRFEGCKLRAYPDPATGGAPWTIGWGSTGLGIVPGIIWSQAQADARFDADIAAFAAKVDRLLEGWPTTQGQFDALVSFAYNLGLANLGKSTLLKDHKAGLFAAAKGQFALWNRANDKVLDGLTKRRAAEAQMYGGTP